MQIEADNNCVIENAQPIFGQNLDCNFNSKYGINDNGHTFIENDIK